MGKEHTVKVCHRSSLGNKADLSLVFIFWPVAKWNLNISDVNISKPSGFHAFFLDFVFIKHEGTTHSVPSFPIDLGILTKRTIFVDSLLRIPVCRNFLVLNPATRLETTEGLLVKSIPVDDASKQEPDVNEIECVFRKSPLAGCIVDLEADIWGNPGWLDRCNVCANYLDIRVKITKITANR